MSAYEPGTVAVATVRGVPNVRVFRVKNIDGWVDESGYAHTPEGAGLDTHTPIVNIRPLVVLDLDAANDSISRDEVVETAIRTLKKSPFLSDTRLAQQIAEQATKPPRIPEPTDLGAVVIAAQVGEIDGSERSWTRFRRAGRQCWIDQLEHVRSWDDLENPVQP